MLRRFFKSRSDLEHPNPKIRRSAIDKLPDIAQDKFLQIAKTDQDISNRLAALNRIETADKLVELLESEPIDSYAAERIVSITKHDDILRADPRMRDIQLRRAESIEEVYRLIKDLKDSKELAAAYLLVKNIDVRNALINSRINPNTLVACEKISRNKDKSLNRASRDRIAEYKGLLKLRKETDHQANFLTNQSASLSNKDPYFNAKVDRYERDWSELLAKISTIDHKLEMYEVPMRDIDALASLFPKLQRQIKEPRETRNHTTFEQLYDQLNTCDGLLKTVFKIEQDWTKQADLFPPPESLAKSFRKRCHEMRQRCQETQRTEKFKKQAQALILDLKLPKVSSGNWTSFWECAKTISKNAEAIHDIRTKIGRGNEATNTDWIIELDRHYSHLMSMQSEIKKTRSEMQLSFNKVVAELEAKVNRGELKSGFSLYRKVRLMLSNLPEHDQSNQQDRIRALVHRLRELQDWQSFAESPKRLILLEQMKNLAKSPLKPLEQHKQLKQFRAEWNSLGHPIGSQQLKLQKQFDEFAAVAYETCKRYFESLADLKQKNLDQKKKVFNELAIFEASIDWSKADWKIIDTKLRKTRKRWQTLQPTDRRHSRNVDASFSKLTALLHKKLKEQWAVNRSKKEALVKEAQQVFDQEMDIRDLVDKVKSLQKIWASTGPIPQRLEDKLWHNFRNVCDKVFERRDKAKLEKSSLLKANIESAHNLSKSATAALEDAIKNKSTVQPRQLQEFEDTLREMDLPTQSKNDHYKSLRSLQAIWREHLMFLDEENHRTEIAQILELDMRLAMLEEAREDVSKFLHEAGPHAKYFENRNPKNADPDELNEIVVRAELHENIPSPEADKEIRLRILVERLNEGMGKRNIEAELSHKLLARWCQIAHGKSAFRERFHQALKNSTSSI